MRKTSNDFLDHIGVGVSHEIVDRRHACEMALSAARPIHLYRSPILGRFCLQQLDR
jgi:hypothetical protein